MRFAARLACLLMPLLAAAQPLPEAPATRRVDHVDIYHGQRVEDPYRWLEDDRSPETAAWVAAQNRHTQAWLARIPFRAALRERLARLQDYARQTVPRRHGDWLVYRRNSGLQNQDVIVRRAVAGGPEQVLLDPNALSADGTTRVAQFVVQPSGRHAAYALSRAGSDWQQIRVMDLDSGRTLDDTLDWVRFSTIAWAGDGFFYARYPQPAAGTEKQAAAEHQRLMFHRIGRPAADDELVWSDPARPKALASIGTSDDGRWAVLEVRDRSQGRRGNTLAVRDLSAAQGRFVPVVADPGDSSYHFAGAVPGGLVISTDDGAPNGKLVLVDPAAAERTRWKTLRAEGPDPVLDVETAGGRVFVTTLRDVTHRVEMLRPDGSLERTVALPGLGTTVGFEGGSADDAVYYGYTSFDTPTTVWRLDIASGRSTPFFVPRIAGWDPQRYRVRQVFYASKDGTRVPMFLVHRADLQPDGSHPTLLYGYGGFNQSLTPTFNPLRLALLEQGVVYAVANIRGGGEYGLAWHQAAVKLKKQTSFDDFIAAAEWLVKEGITRPAKLAVQGGSNGGLLVGAVINQRPELFAAAVPEVGVMDMLRFQRFTIGSAWVADYGSSDDPQQFQALRAYSPLHNIRDGVRYPAVLVTTADHDDRVVPAHSFKYAATLQARAARDRPVLIRIDTSSGHGASSVAKRLDATADVQAFLLQWLGVEPRGLP